ncbi:MAG: hypothetical protein ACPGWS_00540 [Solirubrobacterales bacterium]
MAKPTREKLRSIVLHAAAKLAADRADRGELTGGDSFDVDVTITGTVNGKHRHEERVTGGLLVNHDASRKSSKACDATELVALLLEAIVPTKRRQILASLPRHFAEAGVLPDRKEDRSHDQAKHLLAELRSCSTTTAKGSVRFAPATGGG